MLINVKQYLDMTLLLILGFDQKETGPFTSKSYKPLNKQISSGPYVDQTVN